MLHAAISTDPFWMYFISWPYVFTQIFDTMDYEMLERQELLYWNCLDAWCFCTTLEPNFSNMLKMPKRFVKHFGPKLPDNMILVGRNGHDWPVRLARSSSTESIVFIGGGWKRFVEEQSLQVGDILVFRYGGDFRFDVLTFDHESGCEKTKPFFTNMPRSNTNFFHCQGGAALAGKCFKLPSNDDQERIEEMSLKSSHGWEDDEMSNKKMHKRSTDAVGRRGSWNVGGRGRSRGRFSSVATRNGRGVPIRGGEVVKRGRRGVTRRSWRGRDGNHKTQWKPCNAFDAERNQEELAKSKSSNLVHGNIEKQSRTNVTDRDEASPDTDHSIISDVLQYYRERKKQLIADLKNGPYKLGFLSTRRPITGKDLQVMRASATAFEPPNPSFLVEMRRTHVVKRFVLTIPVEFVRIHLLQRSTSFIVTLQVPGKKLTWMVDCDPMSGRSVGVQLTRGWSDFVFDNVVEEDDGLVFELVENGEDKAVFNVHIFRVVPEVTPLEKMPRAGSGRRRNKPQGHVIKTED